MQKRNYLKSIATLPYIIGEEENPLAFLESSILLLARLLRKGPTMAGRTRKV